MTEKVCFSFYLGEPPIPVNVFKRENWVFGEGLELRASIIGKSHRIVSCAGSKSFTEFIAYSGQGSLFDPMHLFPVVSGQTYKKFYRDGNFSYEVSIKAIPKLFANMPDFLRSLEDRNWKTLDYGFRETKGCGPFTGIAADPMGSTFHTVHTYPEHDHSIVSRSEIHYPA